ncbi:MAG: hypothetical protein M3270_01775 [Thermoproteota archaeon]|nr:hypothetical protein [Thermoproteota archaeon]
MNSLRDASKDAIASQFQLTQVDLSNLLSRIFLLKLNRTITICIMTNEKLRPHSAILAELAVITDPETSELIRRDTGEVISNNMLSQEKE